MVEMVRVDVHFTEVHSTSAARFQQTAHQKYGHKPMGSGDKTPTYVFTRSQERTCEEVGIIDMPNKNTYTFKYIY